MKQIFISHSAEDAAAVAPIYAALEKAGLSTWRDADVPLSADISATIRRAIDEARCIVVIWSQAAAASPWVQHELSRAIEAWTSDRLILVTLDDAPLPVGLRDLNAIRIPGPSDSGLQLLIKSIRDHVRQHSELVEPAHSPVHAAPTVRARTFGAILGFLLVVGLAWLWMILEPTTVIPPDWHPPLQIDPLQPLGLDNTKLFLSLLVVVLIVGIALGAGAFWIWGVRSSRRARKSTHLENNLPSVVQGAESSSPLPIFASYSYQDMVRVDPLVEKIEGWGFGVWIDRNSSGSERYAAKIGPAIRTSKVVALMCSKNAFASDHVIREVYMAGKFKKPFLSFLLDRTELPDEINYFISPYPLLPVTTMHESELKSAVEKFLESEIN